MRLAPINTLLCGGLCLQILGSLVIGDIPFSKLIHDPDLCWVVMETLRLPRTLLACLTGCVLGLSGAALQGLLQNPLAEAGILGISSSASFGAVLALTMGVTSTYVPFFGVMSAFISMMLLWKIVFRQPSTLTLVLVGMAFNCLFSALTSLTLNLSHNPYKNLEIMFWLLGSVSHQSIDSVVMIIPFAMCGAFLLWQQRPLLNALTFGSEVAESLGYSVNKAVVSFIVATALCIGPIAALGGTIGFIGLIAPHIVRRLGFAKPGDLLLPSALGGAHICLLSDMVIRLIPTSSEIRIGVITSLLGAVFFLFLVLTKRVHYDPV